MVHELVDMVVPALDPVDKLVDPLFRLVQQRSVLQLQPQVPSAATHAEALVGAAVDVVVVVIRDRVGDEILHRPFDVVPVQRVVVKEGGRDGYADAPVPVVRAQPDVDPVQHLRRLNAHPQHISSSLQVVVAGDAILGLPRLPVVQVLLQFLHGVEHGAVGWDGQIQGTAPGPSRTWLPIPPSTLDLRPPSGP
jgi:hypothetical protein